MPRPMSTAMLNAITASELFLGIFVQATFQTGPVYLWSGLGPIIWNGHTWTGLGALGGVSAAEEGSTIEAKGLTLTLSGFDATLLPDVMTEFCLLQPVTIWLGCFNSGSLIANPIVIFAGLMDQPTVHIDGEKATIEINCESVLLDLNVATERRYTADDQQRDWAGDLGMNFVNSIQELSVVWGEQVANNTNL